MTIDTLNFVYTLAGKNAPYKIMKFKKTGEFVECIGEVSPSGRLANLANLAKVIIDAHEGSLEVPKVKKTRKKGL